MELVRADATTQLSNLGFTPSQLLFPGNSRSTRITITRVIRCVIIAFAALNACAASAQFDEAISTQELVAPWDHARAVLLSIAPASGAIEGDKRVQIDHDLALLDAELSTFQSQEETVATRIVTDPALSYDASDTSRELATQLSAIGERFEVLWATLQISERADVQAARGSLASLQQRLHGRNSFERDVVRALGSGGKQEILALSARWWTAAQSVEKVREAVTQVRTRLAASPGQQRND